jgi:hypothetical protein
MIQNVNETYPELTIPGHILYIYRIQKSEKKRSCTFFSSIISKCCMNGTNIREYDYRWAAREEFKKILITNRTLIDHFPNSVEDALKYFSRS